MSIQLFLRKQFTWTFLRCAWGDVDRFNCCQLECLRREFSLSMCCPKACNIFQTEMCPGISTDSTNILVNILLQHTFCTRDESGKYPIVEFQDVSKGYARCVYCTVFGKHCECIAQKCTHLERLPPLAIQLLLLSHCELTHHAGHKNKSLIGVRPRESKQGRGTIQSMDQSLTLFDQSYPICCSESANTDDCFKVQIKTFPENWKIQLIPKITIHLFTCYLNYMCKSNPVCLIHQ